MPEKDSLRLVTYCGLYCGLCAERARVPQQARQLRRTLHESGYDFFYRYVPGMKDTYPVFSKFLKSLGKMDCTCRSGIGGPPDCKIRECAKRRKVKVCPLCDDYPCAHIRTLGETYPILIEDGRRMRKIGVTKWISDQEKRVKKGLVYADLKY
jgi:hypothetical protein